MSEIKKIPFLYIGKPLPSNIEFTDVEPGDDGVMSYYLALVANGLILQVDVDKQNVIVNVRYIEDPGMYVGLGDFYKDFTEEEVPQKVQEMEEHGGLVGYTKHLIDQVIKNNQLEGITVEVGQEETTRGSGSFIEIKLKKNEIEALSFYLGINPGGGMDKDGYAPYFGYVYVTYEGLELKIINALKKLEIDSNEV